MSTGVVIRLKNLPTMAGTIDIRRFFAGLSIPDGGVHIIGGEDGTVFILFSTDEDARQAMLRDNEKIVGEKIKLMLSSHTEMRMMIEESQSRYEELRGLRPPEPPITNLTSKSSATGSSISKNQLPIEAEVNELYVELKGMPSSVSQEEIVEFFQNIPISAIRLVLDDKGRQIGQGFVRFKSPSNRMLALKKDRDFLGPRFVRVLPATEKQWVMSSSQVCETWRPGGGENYSSRKRGPNLTPSHEGTPKRSRALSPIRCDNCVELRGLPGAATYKTVQDLFYHLKFTDGGLYLEMDGKHCRGRAFAEFLTTDEYKEALLKDGEILEGKQIRVINISRQAMLEQIKHHKKYLKMKRDEEYKREREELERLEQEKRQLKEEHERHQQEKISEEQQKRKDEEAQRKRREHQLKKQREMEEWLARQHLKEEAERKRQEMEKRAAEEERSRREEEKKRYQQQELRNEEKLRLREYERKRQRELDEIELRIKEEEKKRIKEELLKHELDAINNGSIKEEEMDLESPPKDDFSEHYPPPPSDALLPAKPTPPRYSLVPNSDSDYSSYNKSPPRQSRLSEPPMSRAAEYYPHRYSPPPIPNSAGNLVVPLPSMPLPSHAMISAMPLHSLPHSSLPPPPLPPAVSAVRLVRAPEPPLHVVGEPMYPPPIGAPIVSGGVISGPSLPSVNVAPPVILSPATRPPPTVKPLHSTTFARIANAPFTVSEREIRDFFKGLEIVPNGIQFVMKNGKRSGHIFVKFATETDAAQGVMKDKSRLGGRELLVQASGPSQMTQILKKYETRNFDDLFLPTSSPGSASSSKTPQRDNLNLESNIMQDKLTCVRLGSVPSSAAIDDILRAFTGISIMPNGIHILKMADGHCNGSAFVELVTPEDCIRATNLHATANVQGVPIRVMPVKHQDMDREITDHNIKVFSRPPASTQLPSMPLHPESMGIRASIPPPSISMPPPPLPDREDLSRHRQLLRPPLGSRRRSPTPPHLKNHRTFSPPRLPPFGRARSPPHGPPLVGHSSGPPMRPRSPPMLPPRDLVREEARRAELFQLNRHLEHEQAIMHELHGPGPFGDRQHFSSGGTRFGIPCRFERPPFPDDRQRFPPGLPRFPNDMPPHFIGDGPWRHRFPLEMPRFRMPHVPVKMSNLSFHITQEDILEFFLKFAPIPDSVRLMYNPAGKLTGDGIVSFMNPETADAAMKELNQKLLLSRKIRLSLG